VLNKSSRQAILHSCPLWVISQQSRRRNLCNQRAIQISAQQKREARTHSALPLNDELSGNPVRELPQARGQADVLADRLDATGTSDPTRGRSPNHASAQGVLLDCLEGAPKVVAGALGRRTSQERASEGG
jgi:hypothetical protein